MLQELSIQDQGQVKQWDRFVESHPNGSPFHLSSWIYTLHKTYSFEPLLYAKKDRSGNISGVLPCFLVKSLATGTRIVSLPFSDFAGPLFESDTEEKQAIAECIHRNKHRVKYIQIRSRFPQDSALVPHNYYKLHLLDLDFFRTEMNRTLQKRTIQYSIRKAQKAGVEIREENSRKGLDTFCRLNNLTRSRQGIPCQPRQFFNNLYQYMLAKGRVSIMVATSGSKALASTVLLKFKDTAYYKYNASDPRYLNSMTPNHLLTWHIIEGAYQRGCRFFDFGRTAPDNPGLTRFKEMWGADPLDLPYYYYPDIKGVLAREESSLLYRSLTTAWRSFPEPLTRAMGALIYRHLA